MYHFFTVIYELNNFPYSIVVLNHFEFGVPPLSTTLQIWSLQIRAESEGKAQMLAFHPPKELLLSAGI